MPSSLPVSQAERLKFPGMIPDEVAVWRGWLQQHESEYDRYDYNVRVGAGDDPGPTFSQAQRQGIIASTQLRIDAVAWQGTQATLIEVKQNAQPAAIGQLLTYLALWMVANPSAAKPNLLLVASSITPDFDVGLQHANIAYAVVTPA